ncbi:MAG: hypothetical protein RIS29_950, partial [Bacteroidota bacterium]
NFYQNLSDADRAVLGVYAQFTSLAKQVVVLNELRADMMDVTTAATPELEKLNLNQIDSTNTWVSPLQFYAVINSCNDVLANFDKMLAENKFTRDEYNERYSDIGALRTWIYLQLVNIYGSVPYITEPLVNLTDVEKYKGQRENADVLLPKLIEFMKSLPLLDDYTYSNLINGNPNGYSLEPMFISKKILLGDLYLYNNQYAEAAHYYRIAMSTDETSANLNAKRMRYRLYNYAFTATSGEPGWYAIVFRDGHIEDENGMINTWKYIFSDVPTSRKATDRASMERIWCIPFDDKLKPVNPFTNIFEGYQLKASDYAMDSLWGKPMRNQFPYDARGKGGSYTGNGLISKYSGTNSNTLAKQHGYWMLYRAAGLHLRYAEAANRAGYPYLAWCFLNNGIKNEKYRYKKADGSYFPDDSCYVTGKSPFEPYPTDYRFDARYPREWDANAGVRGRAFMPVVNFPAGLSTQLDSIQWLEKQIVREAGLELAFEGQRWSDLVRIARRMNKEGRDGFHFLFDENIKKKYERANIPAPNFSTTESSWYLPFYE